MAPICIFLLSNGNFLFLYALKCYTYIQLRAFDIDAKVRIKNTTIDNPNNVYLFCGTIKVCMYRNFQTDKCVWYGLITAVTMFNGEKKTFIIMTVHEFRELNRLEWLVYNIN